MVQLVSAVRVSHARRGPATKPTFSLLQTSASDPCVKSYMMPIDKVLLLRALIALQARCTRVVRVQNAAAPTDFLRGDNTVNPMNINEQYKQQVLPGKRTEDTENGEVSRRQQWWTRLDPWS